MHFIVELNENFKKKKEEKYFIKSMKISFRNELNTYLIVKIIL